MEAVKQSDGPLAWHKATLYYTAGLFASVQRFEMKFVGCGGLPPGSEDPQRWAVTGKPRGRRKMWQVEIDVAPRGDPRVLVIFPGWGHFVPPESNATPLDDESCAWYPPAALVDRRRRDLYEFRRAVSEYGVDRKVGPAFVIYQGPPFELVVYDPHGPERLLVVDDYWEAHGRACELAAERTGVIEVGEGSRTVARFFPHQNSSGWQIEYRLTDRWPMGLTDGSPRERVQRGLDLGDGRVPV